MYQNPVLGLEKIRRSRKNVKSILSDFGLEICQELIEHDLQDVSSDEDEIDDTEWTDLTVGFNGRQKKKWKYRTQTLCCSLCKYTARSWSSYHHHIKVYHPEEKHLTYLSACSACPFIAHPRLVKKHFALFHHDLSRSSVAATGTTTVGSGSTTGDSGLVPVTSAIAAEKYLCRKCGFEDTLLYCMKKHVLFKHAINLWQMHAGQRAESQQKALGCSKFYCKTCGANSETTEHLVYHLLTSDKHKDIGRLVLGLIWQKMRPRRAEERQGQTFYVANANTSSALAQEAAASAPLLALSSSANSSLQASLSLPSGAVLPGLGATPSTLLPAQHAALVQLASAEAKGLIRVDGSASLSGAQVMSTSSAAAAQVQRAQQTQLGMVVGPPGHGQPTVQQLLAVRRPVPVQSASGAAGGASAGAGAKALVHRPGATPQATVLTSQSLLSHLVPTGNKVNGMPTYTLAPLQMNMAGVQANKGSVVSKLPLQSNASLSQSPFAAPGMDPCKTKKWTSCSLCRELFPSSVFDKHMETHRLKAKNGLAAKAPFLKKMPDRTVKCLTCKVLLSERGIFEHMKHGLMCLYCPKMFNSIKALAFHVKSDHHNVEKEHGDFMRREYKLYTDEKGNLLFPYFDISTTASKDMLGDQEVHLALVTTTKDLLFIKMSPSGDKPVCSAATAATKSSLKHCPFCGEDTLSAEDQRMHLREKHFITPTIHAILKTPAYKCVFCGGVYTGKTTMMAIIVHLQRCKAAPKTPLDAERLMSSTVVARSNGGGGVRQPTTTRPQQPLSNKHLSNKKLSPAAAAAPGSLSAEPVSEVEAQRARRLEMAVKEAMMANKREREARAAKRKLDREQRRSATPPSAASGSGVGQAEALIDPSVPLALNPAGMWKRTFEERREFLTRYFHVQPYLAKKEMTALANALLLNNLDVACHFSTKRNKCLRAVQRTRVKVIMGFNMAEMLKVKHNLFVPEQVEPPEPTEEKSDDDDSEPSDGEDGGEKEEEQEEEQEEEVEGGGGEPKAKRKKKAVVSSDSEEDGEGSDDE